VKKLGVDNWEEKLENAKPNEVDLPKTMEADKNKSFRVLGNNWENVMESKNKLKSA
jgi:hypothetical protein